ncbi:MAG: M48 family metallopeptidase [Acidobacteria bacterium]|nr:M48 family metallopeptidase [Acidobacteriota bacterium]
MRSLFLIVSFCLFLTSSVYAQQPTATPDSQQTSAQSPTDPVPVPEPSEKALSYYRSGIVLWIVGVLWGLLIPALFLFTGFSARIRDWARKGGQIWFSVISKIDSLFYPRVIFTPFARIGRTLFFIVGLYFAIFLFINFVIDFPLNYYQGFARQHAYGLSNQTLGKWFGDQIIGLLLGIGAGFLFLWIPYLLLKKSPRRWWLYTGLLAIPFLILVILVQPVWIDPLFNKFGAMNNKELETRILALAERAGIEGGRVYEVAKSEDTKALNAYVTGFGATKRIVLWDTIIAKLDEDELLFVMGHEMGHYVLGHVWKSILFFSLLIIATLYAIHRTAGWLINKYQRRFGFTELSDIASLPLIILLFSVYFLIVTPIALAFSRHNEHEADRFGLEITRNNRAGAMAFVKLQQENLVVPRPHILVKLWQASHPTLGERIEFSNEYRPWEKGEALRYGDLFKQAK